MREWQVWHNHVNFGMAIESDRYIVFDNALPSPAGQLKMAGVLRQSEGVPAFRTFGSYALVYVTGGHGYFRDTRGFSSNILPGDLLLLFPDVGHAYGPVDENPWDETFVVFEGPVFDLWRQEGFLSPSHPLYRLDPVEHWHQRIIATAWTDTKRGSFHALARLCRLQQLLADIMVFEEASRRTETDWLMEAFTLLQQRAESMMSEKELSEQLGMSYEGFRKRFAREAGISPGRYLTQLRMQRACEMLSQGGATVRSVGNALGFYDEFHFSRQFKKFVGVTPSEFRRLFH